MNSAIFLLERTVLKYPDRVAVEDDEGTFTYAQLRNTARIFASNLIENTLDNAPIMIYLPKSKEYVVSMMGALYGGTAYSPVDYEVPINRLKNMIDSLKPGVIITDEQGEERLKFLNLSNVLKYSDMVIGTENSKLIQTRIRNIADLDLIYIMYTSGSTGEPKGVMITHRGVIDYTSWVVDTFKLSESSVLGLQSGFHFDNSVFDIYSSFAVGGKVVIIPEKLFMYPHMIPGFLSEHKISCIFWVPTVMIAVANTGKLEGADLQNLKTVAFAGEVMPNKHLNIWRKAVPHAVFANLYGPTEITVDCTCYIVDREFSDNEPLPIGKPRHNMSVFLVDEQGEIVSNGQSGEICVVGSAVARGYWDAPEITYKAFVPSPRYSAFDEIMYKTGDMGKFDSDGNLMYLGRRDNQFKYRGNRIELGDIEAAALCIEGIDEACAIYLHDREEIVLFVVSEKEITLRQFNLHMAKHVPKYMLPKHLKRLNSLPLSPNRKVDRNKLQSLWLREIGL